MNHRYSIPYKMALAMDAPCDLPRNNNVTDKKYECKYISLLEIVSEIESSSDRVYSKGSYTPPTGL